MVHSDLRPSEAGLAPERSGRDGSSAIIPAVSSQSFANSVIGPRQLASHFETEEHGVLRSEFTQRALIIKSFLSGVPGLYGWSDQEFDFRGELPRQLRVEIPESCRPSNAPSGQTAKELLYIHGMRVGAEDLDLHLSYLALCFGKPIQAIINRQEEPLFKADSRGGIRSVGKSAAGILSAKWGSQLEVHAVLTTARQIEKQVIDKGESLQVVAHSQGTIILSNALDYLLGSSSKLSAEQKQLICDRLSIITFGSGEHFFAKGLEAFECAHQSDPVTRITTPTTFIRHYFVTGVSKLHSALSQYLSEVSENKVSIPAIPPVIEKERVPVVHLKGDHELKGYLENFPEFYIERFRDSNGDLDSTQLANDLATSIIEGKFSDLIHARIIQERVGEGDIKFGEVLKGFCSEDGKIGEFSVPFFQQLGRG